MKLDDSKLMKLKSKEPSIGEIEHVLEKISNSLKYKFVDDGEYVFLASREDVLENATYAISKNSSYLLACKVLMNCIFNAMPIFRDGKTNPFYGCKTLEEAMVRADLLEDVR